MSPLRGWIARALVRGRRWRNSFRVRLLALGLIAITGTAVALTYTQSIQMREALLVELNARARADGQLLNAMFAAPLTERDYASVAASVSESVRAGSFEALLLCDSRGYGDRGGRAARRTAGAPPYPPTGCRCPRSAAPSCSCSRFRCRSGARDWASPDLPSRWRRSTIFDAS